MAELVVEEAVEEEVGQAGDDDFTAFFFDHADDVVVGNGVELDVDFTDQADARFLFFTHFDVVEFMNEVAKVALKGCKVGLMELFRAFFLPLVEQGFGRTFDLFVRPRAV